VILGDFDFDDFEEQPLARVLFFVHTTLGTILLLSILVAMYVTVRLRAGWWLMETDYLPSLVYTHYSSYPVKDQRKTIPPLGRLPHPLCGLQVE
jgi:hypothetical protein